MKYWKVWLGLTVCAGISLGWADGQYQELKLEDKLKDKDLTFAVTFDKKNVNADYAKGNAISTTLKDVGLLLRGVVGFDSQGAFQPEAGEDLRFDAAVNADPHQGTLMLWVAGIDYSPGSAETEGKKRGNIALAHLWFQQGEQHIEFQLYEYGDTVYFDWRSSEPPHGWGQIGRVQAERKRIKQREWHQLAATWNNDKLIIYLNGEKCSETALPVKYKKTASLKAESGKSFIGVKSRFYEDKHNWTVGIDDFKIYSRALSDIEIRNQYRRLLKDQSAAEILAYSLKLNGVNIGWNDPINRLEAEFDFAALPDPFREQLDKGNLAMSYTLTAPDGKQSRGEWNFAELNATRILQGVDQVGKYILATQVGKEKVTASIERPDFSFVGNGIGDEDTVPVIWKDFAFKDRTVTLWNRVYRFSNGPLPVSITVKGESLLDQSPRLLIDGAELQYQPGPTRHTNRTVTFTGTGKGKNFTLDYNTTIEFDGLIKLDYIIKGSPEIKSMQLTWQVNPLFCQFLLTPELQERKNPEYAFPYPKASGRGAHKQLWLVSEGKGGFCYTMEHDANWVYAEDKPVFFLNRETGLCRVEMINKTVKLPEDTSYGALFIASPTRPLPERNRVLRFADTTRSDTPRLGMAGGGDGLTGVFTYEPHPTAFAEAMENRVPNTVSVYGSADALTTASPEANYLRKYWERPGSYSYKMRYCHPLEDGKTRVEYYFSLSACNSGIINDYYLNNINKLLNHEYGDRIWQIYFDLCGNNLCGNPWHKCRFNDKFGREIKTFSILTKRKLIERTVRLAHVNGRTVMLHAQRDFSPILHGLADYYFPGEQYNTLLARNPYGYTDEISDNLYRSEFNRNTLGVGVVHLPALGQANRSYFRENSYTEAMICMLQSHDIDTTQDWAAGKPLHDLWNALEKYSVGAPSTKCHLYYQQQELISSNPDIRITWYECPGKHYVLFLANKDIRTHRAMIDVSGIAPGNFTAREEYRGSDVQVSDGKFEIRVPARSFRVVGFPPKSFYPHTDNCNNRWRSWKRNGSDTHFASDLKDGHDAPGSMLLIHRETGGGVFLKGFPTVPGKTYTASVWVKQENAQRASLNFQGRKENKFLGTPVQSVNLPFAPGWSKIENKFTVPTIGKWAECDNLLVTLGASGNNSTTWFDDFMITEE